MFTHPRLRVSADGYHVRIDGNVRLTQFEAAKLARSLAAHLEQHGHTI